MGATEVAGHSAREVSNKDLYDVMMKQNDAINAVRLELKGDIRDLRNQFDTLEAGRLTRAEGDISSLRVELQKAINQFQSGLSRDALRTTKLSATQVVVFSILGAIGVAILTALAYRLIVGAK